MKNDDFIYRSHCELAITSKEIDPELITKELDIIPSRLFKKGDQTFSKYSGSIITKPWHLWALRSETVESRDETINSHIEYFKSVSDSKIDILNKYKSDDLFDVGFTIWIETDNAGLGFELDSHDFVFLTSISNRIRFSFLTF